MEMCSAVVRAGCVRCFTVSFCASWQVVVVEVGCTNPVTCATGGHGLHLVILGVTNRHIGVMALRDSSKLN